MEQIQVEIHPIGLNELTFDTGNASLNFFGNTKALGVWKEALTDAELRSLTYPTPTAPTFDLDFNTIATDFTFTRNSEATFVNAQGLIQSTNELGAELIVGGDFSNPSDWNLSGTNLSISNGKGISTGSNFGAQFKQTILTINKVYTLTFDIVDYTSGKIGTTANYYGETQVFNSVGTHTATFTSLSQTEFRLYSQNFIGSIDNVSVKEYITETNTPRLDYSTGAEAFLLEPQRTNLIQYSEDFSGANWIVFSDITVTPNTTDVLSPSGFYNANKVVSTNATRGFYYTGLSVTSDATRTIYLKGSVGGETVLLKDGSGNGGSSAHTLTTDWARYELKTTNDGNTYQGLFVDDISVGTIYAWGTQFEEGSYATSYIPTSGTTVTRNQELCNDATPVINSEEGVLYAEVNFGQQSTVSRYISLSDGSNSNRVIIGVSANTSSINTFVTSGGVTQANMSYPINISNTNKVALKYKKNNFALFINGIRVFTDSSGLSPIGLNSLNFNQGNNGAPFSGNTKGLKYYPKALSDVELQDLTTI